MVVGDVVYLSDIIFTARDMAHIRIMEYLREGKQLVEDFGAAVFHAGPVVRKKKGKWEISVIGPTTSMRMEPFSETLLGKLGVKAIIGKGGMGEGTQEALRKYCGVYLLSHPGCAVIQSKAVSRVLRFNWLDLGVPEAVWRRHKTGGQHSESIQRGDNRVNEKSLSQTQHRAPDNPKISWRQLWGWGARFGGRAGA